MLTRLKIRNFKALKDVDLSLRQRNVFIGRNNSGKSSLLQALIALANMVLTGDVSRAFNGAQGLQQFLWKGESETFVEFELWGDDGPVDKKTRPTQFHYLLQVGLDPQFGLSVNKEVLSIGPSLSKHLIKAERGIGTATRADGEVIFSNPQSALKPFLSYQIPGWEAENIRKYIQGWQFFQLMPELSKGVTTQPPAPLPYLDVQGVQISAWLHTFQTNYPDAFRRVVSAAQEAFPEIESLSTPVNQGGTALLSSTERDLRSPVSIIHASDGEIKFLQLLSIIFSPLDVRLVALEEPESHLHPRLIELLVEAANNARTEFGESAAQLFVTTHSPYLIDKLDPEDVVVIDKVRGAAQFQRAIDKADIRRMLEEGELSFGRLWYSGALGGV